MMDVVKNSARATLFETVASYNSTAMLNRLDYEIILEGLKVYLNIDGCTSATLFSIDQETYDFYYRTSTSLHLEDKIKKIFDGLIHSDAVAEALRSSDIMEYDLLENEGQKNYCLLIPLVVPSGVIGINLIIINRSLKEQQQIITLCRLHSNNFALITHSCVLSYELNQIKENTEQKIALRTNDIVKNTRELKKILDSIQTGILIVNKSTGLISDANLLAATIIGMSKENLIGRDKTEFFFFLGPKDATQRRKINEEGLLKKNNGTLIPIIKTEAEVILGGVNFAIESFIDISERKSLENTILHAHFELERRVEERTAQLSKINIKLAEEMREREKAESDILKLYWAVMQSPVAIIITDLNGVIEYVNDKFVELSGYKFEEAVGSTPRILKSGYLTSEDYRVLWNTLLEEREWALEYKNRKKNGELYWVSAHVSPIRNKYGDITHYLGIQEDITDKKQILDELLIAKNRAEESDKLKSSLLANMSHEFRTPLIGVLGFSQLLLTELSNKEQVEMVENINHSGKRLLDTLDGVLSLSELSSMDSSLKFSKINVAEFLNNFIPSQQKRAREKNLELKLEIKSSGLFVSVEPELLNKSLKKIVDNAIKYTNMGSITVVAEIEKDADQNWIVIRVGDTGIGIAMNDQELIFEAFRQSSEGYSRRFEGCGLGLSLAKKMIELLNGRIVVTSQLSVGSEFSIWLPAVGEEAGS